MWYNLLWLTLGIPVLIHLVFRRRSRRIPFSSLFFLRLVDQRIARRQKIKQWLLLLTRLGILAAVIWALSHPMLRTSSLGGRNVKTTAVIVLDNSYSMRAVQGDKSAWARARQVAVDVLEILIKGDSAAIVLVSPDPTHKTGITSDITALRREVGELPCGWGGTDLAGALKRANEVLASATTSRRELFIITDMQSLAWTDAVTDALKAVPEHTETFLVDAGTPIEKNLALTNATTGLRVAVKDVPTRIRLSMRNTGAAAVEGVARMVIDDRRVAERVVTVVPGGSRTDAFAWSFDHAGYDGGYFQSEPDSLEADNRRYFALRIHEKIPVLVVNGDPSPISFNDECFFLVAALRVSTHAGRSLSPIEPVVIPATDLPKQNLEPFKVVILANVARVDAGTAERLRLFVRRGGGAMFFMGPKVDLPAYNTYLWDEDGDKALLPARLARVVNVALQDKKRPYETIMSLQESHLALRDIADELDMSSGRIKSYIVPMMEEKGASGNILIRLSSGKPLLIEKHLGSGSVFVWTSSADLDWDNMALKPFFLPLLHQLIYYTSRSGSESESIGIGHVKRIRINDADKPVSVKVERLVGPEDTNETEPLTIDSKRTPDGWVADFGRTGLPGLYKATFTVGDKEQTVLFAVNVDTEESDLKRLDLQDATKHFTRPVRLVSRPEQIAEAVSIEREGLPLWDYLFALALILGVAESYIANRWIKG